jgi:hypothetical protein
LPLREFLKTFISTMEGLQAKPVEIEAFKVENEKINAELQKKMEELKKE